MNCSALSQHLNYYNVGLRGGRVLGIRHRPYIIVSCTEFSKRYNNNDLIYCVSKLTCRLFIFRIWSIIEILQIQSNRGHFLRLLWRNLCRFRRWFLADWKVITCFDRSYKSVVALTSMWFLIRMGVVHTWYKKGQLMIYCYNKSTR